MKTVIFDNNKSTEYSNITHLINMGESIVPEAVKIYLAQIGEKSENIETTPYFGSFNYKESVQLMVVGHFGRQYDFNFIDNSAVHPLFISFGWKDYFLMQREVDYFKKNEPILCRDEFTRNVMRRYGIEAYLFGCITLSLPYSQEQKGQNIIYFVDVPKQFLDTVPSDIIKNAIITSQNIRVQDMSDNIVCQINQAAKDRLSEYRTKAKMVVTTKLHCMTPCVAMGIPTIAVGDNFSYRYSYIDKFVTSYSLEEFANFNWNNVVKPKNVEVVKNLQIEIGRQLFDGTKDIEKMKKLDTILMNRKKWDYLKRMRRDIFEIADGERERQIILWGASSGGYAVSWCLKFYFPELEVVSVVDMYAKGCFAGKEVCKPEQALKQYPEAIVFISTLSGMQYAKQFCERMGRKYYVVHENE